MKWIRYWTFTALLTTAACGGDDNGGKGPARPSITGRIDRSQPMVIRQAQRPPGNLRRVDTSLADAIWAVPVGPPLRLALNQRTILPLEEDGSFTFTPEQQGIDYILALVNSAACTNTKPREDWTDVDVDARLDCILGYVSIPDAEGSGAMVAIPTSTMTSDTDTGTIIGDQDGDATASGTLQDVAQSFSIGLDGLRDIARVDNTLKALAYTYANMSDDGSGWYELNPNYTWFAPDAIESMADAPSDPWDFLPVSWGLYWGTSVDVDGIVSNFSRPGYFQFIAPHGIDNIHSTYSYPPGAPIGSEWIVGERQGDNFIGFLDGALRGAAEGVWKIIRDGSVVAKLDMGVSSPFESHLRVLDLGHITSYVPVVELETSDGSQILNVRVSLKTWDGVGYADANERLAFNRFELFGATLNGDSSAACPSDSEWTSDWDTVSDTEMVWAPSGAWVIGDGDATHCGLKDLSISYRLFGADYAFGFRRTRAPITVEPMTGPYLPLDPDNGIDGTYVGFRTLFDLEADHWREVDLWAEISGITTTPTAGLVGLGSGEDGLFHLGRRGQYAWFYLEYSGSGSPPAAYDTTATLKLYDGQPGQERRSLTFPVAWSNTVVPAEDVGLSVDRYESLPVVSQMPHGQQHEITVRGTIAGLSQGEHFSFSPASATGWPADEYELIEVRSMLLSPGTSTASAAPCLDAACTETWYNPSPYGLSFYASETADVDYLVQYLFRWTGAGSEPQLSSQVFSLGTSSLHALASDNAAAPTLPPSLPTAQMALAVTPTTATAGVWPIRVTYEATITHDTTDGFFADRITIAFPGDGYVIPRTSRWSLTDPDPTPFTHADEAIAEPTVNDSDVYEWPVGSFLSVGSYATLRFEYMMAATAGAHTAQGQAWVADHPVDVTTDIGDSVPATATVTISP